MWLGPADGLRVLNDLAADDEGTMRSGSGESSASSVCVSCCEVDRACERVAMADVMVCCDDEDDDGRVPSDEVRGGVAGLGLCG